MSIRDLVSGAGYVLDTPGALLRGALSGRPGTRAGGRDLLESWGLMGKNRPGMDTGDVAGFVAELLLDPLNLVGGAGVLRTAGKAAAATKANKLSQALRAKRYMPEEVAALTKIKDATGKPQRLFHGTTKAFGSFDANKMDPHSLYGPGVYLTDSPTVASEYTGKGWASEVALRPDVNPDQFLKDAWKARRVERDLEPVTDAVIDDYIRGSLSSSSRATGSHYAADIQAALDDLKQTINSDVSFIPKSTQELLDRYAVVAKPTANVRAQFVDARRPFQIDAEVMPEDIARFPRQVHDVWRANADLSQGTEPKMLGRDLYDALEEFTGSRAKANAALRNAGYDSIQHEGGKIMGNQSHNVTIALDPSQVYKPYIAPRLQPVPTQRKALAELSLYNAFMGSQRANAQRSSQR